MTRDAAVKNQKKITPKISIFLGLNLITPMRSAAVKRECPEGKELSSGWGIKGAIVHTTSCGLGRHLSIPKFRAVYTENVSMIVKNIWSDHTFQALSFL